MQNPINKLTKRKIWAKSENFHTQIGSEKIFTSWFYLAHYWRVHLSYFNGLIVQIDPVIYIMSENDPVKYKTYILAL